MPTIEAFRGLRYDLGHVGALDDVVAPPYDVIDADFRDRLFQRHPANVIRLILSRDEPGDEPDEKYQRAARHLKNWRREGVLQLEPDPAVYIYHQIFDYGGKSYTRRGFMCRMRLEPFGEGRIFPHEETHSRAKVDRLKLIRACRANLSPVFGLYPDPSGQVQEILEAATAGQVPVQATDHLGVQHRLWPVTDIKVIGHVASVMASKRTFIADGHHRYETACEYRDELNDAGELDPRHPANSVLMMCVGMSDPGMIVLPTHRLLRGLPDLTSEQLQHRLGECFQVRPGGEGPAEAAAIWAGMEQSGDQETLAFYTAADRRWLIARLTEAGQERLDDVASDYTYQWRELGVSILHKLAIETLLEADSLPEPKYVHLIQELVDCLQADRQGEFPLAALVMPATLDHVRIISQMDERMPAKSTYFYPKLLSGLVISPHD